MHWACVTVYAAHISLMSLWILSTHSAQHRETFLIELDIIQHINEAWEREMSFSDINCRLKCAPSRALEEIQLSRVSVCEFVYANPPLFDATANCFCRHKMGTKKLLFLSILIQFERHLEREREWKENFFLLLSYHLCQFMVMISIQINTKKWVDWINWGWLK